MPQSVYGDACRGSGPETYERYFVPEIGRPSAAGLIAAAGLTRHVGPEAAGFDQVLEAQRAAALYDDE